MKRSDNESNLDFRWRFGNLESLKARAASFIIYSLFKESENSERTDKTKWKSHITIKCRRVGLLIWRRKYGAKNETHTMQEFPKYFRPSCSQNPSKFDKCRTTSLKMTMMHWSPIWENCSVIAVFKYRNSNIWILSKVYLSQIKSVNIFIINNTI